MKMVPMMKARWRSKSTDMPQMQISVPSGREVSGDLAWLAVMGGGFGRRAGIL